MQIEQYPLGPLVTNTYLLFDQAKREAVVIDPGEHPQALLERIAKEKLRVQAILLTHAHFDHIAGLEEVRAQTEAPVYVHQREQDWLTDANRNGSTLWEGISPVVCQPADHVLTGEEQLTLLGRQVRVLETPGHSPGSVSYWLDDQIFSGDVLFKGSIGRTDLPGGDADQLTQSLQALLRLPGDTAIHPGHGPQTSLAEEQQSNPFLR